MQLSFENVGFSVGGRQLLRDISFEVASGTIVGLLGVNGSGKSTLLRTAYRYHHPDTGRVLLNGVDIASLSAPERARQIAVMTQENSTEFDLEVLDVVMMARTPYQRGFRRGSTQHTQIALAALHQVGAQEWVHRAVADLSGGERQRVMLARAIAQQAQVLILDEPTNHLDVAFQFELLETVRALGQTSIISLHDLNLALRYCDRVAVLAEGKLIDFGAPATVLTASLLSSVFGVNGAPYQPFGADGDYLALSPLASQPKKHISLQQHDQKVSR